METYGMAAPLNDNVIDCYHQYVAQTGYRCERPEDGDHLKEYTDNPREEYEALQHSWYPQRSRNYQRGPVTYRAAGYHSPSRNVFNQTRFNPRNGLYTPETLSRGGGDHYNSLPCNPYDSSTTSRGLGGYDRIAWQRQARSRNRWF